MSDLQSQLDPTPSQVLEALMESMGADIRVGIPGVVTRVESTDPPRVTVAPAVRRQGAANADPAIPGIPVAVMRSGGATVALPVSVGDPVWLMISDRELDAWIAGGGSKRVTAADPRTHDLADCVAYPMDIGSLPTGAAGNAWFGGSAVTSIVEGVAVKLGRLAVDYLLKGTTFNAAHLIMLTAVATGFTTLATFVGAVVAATTVWAASGKNLGDVDIWITAVGAAANTAGAGITAAATAIQVVFLPAQTTWTSTKVSTE